MKKNSFNLSRNMSVEIGGHKIDDILTKAGSVIDAIRGEAGKDGTATKIGEILDSLTDDINISLDSSK